MEPVTYTQFLNRAQKQLLEAEKTYTLYRYHLWLTHVCSECSRYTYQIGELPMALVTLVAQCLLTNMQVTDYLLFGTHQRSNFYEPLKR
jgi:hypothetical protein